MQSSVGEAARRLLLPLDVVALERYVVVGSYVRYDPSVRGALQELRQSIESTFHAHTRRPNNFLLWGTPGSGKSFLVQQIASRLRGSVEYCEVNLAQEDASTFSRRLSTAFEVPRPLLCFVDEIDARLSEPWPFATLLPYLEPPVTRQHPVAIVLAGSRGGNLASMKDFILAAPKGKDLLSRLPSPNEISVAPLEFGDRILVSVAQLFLAAREEGRPVREVEKLALQYVATQPNLGSARQLRTLALQSARRIPPGEERIKYDYLFHAGDPENKRFWSEAHAVAPELEGAYVLIDAGTSVGSTALASHPSDRAPTIATTDGTRRLAVLPFVGIGPKAEEEFFSDGLTEELIGVVSRIPRLSVISRTSVMRYKGSGKPIFEIGAELGVPNILEGSVRHDGARVRVTARLIDVAADTHLWAEQYDRSVSDIFAIHSEIATEVAKALNLRLFPQDAARIGRVPTETSAAHTAYLKGRYFCNKMTKDWLNKALVEFDGAIREDPEYAPAHAGLADTYLLLGRRGDLEPEEAYPKAIESAERALALDPNLAEPHAALGSIRQEHQWRWKESESEFRRALKINPSYATAHSWYSLLLGHVGRFEEAIAESLEGVSLDPLAIRSHAALAEELLFARKYDEAIRAAQTGLELDPTFGSALIYIASAMVEQGRFEEAAKNFEEADRRLGAQASRGRLGHALARLGRRTEALEIVRELQEGRVEPHVGTPFLTRTGYASLDIGLVHLGLTDFESAIDWFEKARDDRVPEVVHFPHEPIYDPVRSHPRFRAILVSIGQG